MTFTWLSFISSKKGLVLASTTASTPALFPQIFGELDTLTFSIVAWAIVVMLSIWEYWTSPIKGTGQEKKENHKKERSELFSKVITYSLTFIFIVFLHSWVSNKYNVYFSSITGFLVVALYIIAAMGELNFIGINIETKYGTKPSIFKFLDKLNDKFQKMIISRIESRACKIVDEEKNTK